MAAPSDKSAHSWFGDSRWGALHADALAPESLRLWLGFMNARLVVGVVLLLVQGTLLATGLNTALWPTLLCAGYCAATVASRYGLKPRPLGDAINPLWALLVGVDMLTFAALHLQQSSNINYTPLFALPILFASVLGSLSLALGTAAAVTLLLLGGTYWHSVQALAETTPYLVQAALSSAGYLAVAFLTNQLVTRLVQEGLRARSSQLAATVQKRVNELVIDTLPDGVLIVDARGWVRAANPAARDMLGLPRLDTVPTDLKAQAHWAGLLQLARLSLGSGFNQEEKLRVQRPDQGARSLLVRTRLAQPLGAEGESLCVLFLQDQRELEARLRTEKLASMGRMSAAVAHEIRNPLAAIVQANALLGEDLHDARLQRLTDIVAQNAQRLGKIVDDILNVTRVQPQGPTEQDRQPAMELCSGVHAAVAEWLQQHPCGDRLLLQIPPQPRWVRFDPDHLRRVLVNLLDNGLRHASASAQALQVHVLLDQPAGGATVSVWSEGAPLESAVQQHLFEPFFSSESRSSGLGLFICRQLCEQHGAGLYFRRTQRPMRHQSVEGNEFAITLQGCAHGALEDPTLHPPWQTTLY
ncbi:MAG: sensor histidine kinase [Rhodoferax sp.]